MTTSKTPMSTSHLNVGSSDPALDIEQVIFNFFRSQKSGDSSDISNEMTQKINSFFSDDTIPTQTKTIWKHSCSRCAKKLKKKPRLGQCGVCWRKHGRPYPPIDKHLQLHPVERMELVKKEHFLVMTHTRCSSPSCKFNGRLPVLKCNDGVNETYICLDCYGTEDLSNEEMTRLKALFPEYYLPASATGTKEPLKCISPKCQVFCTTCEECSCHCKCV